jgi:two-component system NtrC family sensor kinase
VTFWVSLIVIVIVSIHIYLMRPEQRFLEQKMLESERMARVIETHLLAEMVAGEPDNIQRHLEMLPDVDGIRRVEVVDPAMTVHFSSDSARVGMTIERATDPACKSCHDQSDLPERIVYDLEGVGKVFAVDHVLFNGSECQKCHGDQEAILGNILVELEFTEPDLAALSARRRLVVVGVILLVIMLFGMGAIVHGMVGRPAAALLDKMERIESGEFDMGAPRRSRDEFGVLDRGFHTMVGQLQQLYTQMETLIRERTNKLYETQAQVMHQEKLAGIGQLAAGVAHEIGNPLTAIDSMTQLLALESDDPNVREKVSTIQRQVDRISEIVHSMADLSRPLPLDERFLNVNAVIHSVLALVRYDARFRHITIQTELDEEIPCVKTVEDRLFGVFLNIVLNAADAMPDGGVLHIRSAREGNAIIASFRDTGHGIAPEHLDRVFDAYFTTKEAGKGTGLGLSVCRSFLRGVGGDIDVVSELDKGTTFRVRVPIEPQQLEEAFDEPQSGTYSDRGRRSRHTPGSGDGTGEGRVFVR